MKIRYTFSFPMSVESGGGTQVIKDITNYLSKNNDIQPLDINSTIIDFDTFIFFGSTYFSPEVLHRFKDKSVKIIIFPIFDRNRPLWYFKALKWMLKFPVENTFSYRSALFSKADLIITANESESRDLHEIYNVPDSKMKVLHYGISDKFYESSEKITANIFIEKYKVEDFVFCPAASISKRKNQLTLIKALKGSGVKLVLNNTHNIKDGLESEFNELTKDDQNIICLESLSDEELISAYKAAKVSVSVSQSETAGLVNLEAGYLGCNLVVSDLESLREYLKDYPIFVDQNNPEQIKQAVLKALKQDYNPEIKDFIVKNYTWGNYIDKLNTLLNNLT